MRQRLTTRIAEDMTVKSKGETKESKGSGIDNDVYDMNDTGHEKNDPKREEYAKGDPSAWAEDVYTKPVNTDDSKREETGHAPLIDKHATVEAIATVRRLEEKAARCIVASQRALPGAERTMIEAQAASFMHLPDSELNATLARQEKLARMIAAAADEAVEEAQDSDDAEKDTEKDTEKAKDTEAACVKTEEAGKKEKKDEDLPDFLKEKLASLEAEIATLKEAATKGVSSVNTNKTEMNITNAAEECKENEEAEKKEEKAKDLLEEAEEMEENGEDKDAGNEVTFGDDEGKEASDDSLLDQIFSTVTASAEKKGAKTLAGLVKKEASSGGVNLDSILMDGVPPNVSHLFQ